MSIYLQSGDIKDMQGPCPTGYHVPTKDEWQAIYDAYTGLGLSGSTDFSTYLKLPMAGSRYYNKSVANVGSYGIYWSSNHYNTNNAYHLVFSSSNITPQDNSLRSTGFSVRCLKDFHTIPTASWTTLYQGSGSAGIFHNPTDGLISISSDGTTWYTLMDKNLGATTVYNYGDTLTDANCGNVFQRGNNYAFPGTLSSDSITSSSTQVNVTGYGPGNYYNSSTWITASPRQSSASDGNNLRGGVTGPISMKEVQNIYIGDTIHWQPTANTIAWWKLEGDFKDYSGNNRDLTNSGVTFTSGGPSQVAVFTDSTTYAYYQNQSLFNISYPYTFNTWVKASSIGNYEYVFIGVQDGDYVPAHDKEVGFKNYNYVYSYVWSGYISKLQPSTIVSTNTWYNVIYTYDGSNQKIYINGTLAGSLSTSSSSTTYTNARLMLSKNGSTDSGVYPFSGNLSHVIVENKAWSVDEVTNYFNLTKGKYGL